MGTLWLHWSIHPSPLSPFPGAALCRLESKGNISVVASGCSWLPPFPWILGALRYWELMHHWGFPSCAQLSCLQLSISPSTSHWVLGFFPWVPSRVKP